MWLLTITTHTEKDLKNVLTLLFGALGFIDSIKTKNLKCVNSTFQK